MLALYCSGTVFLRAASLRTRLYSSWELFVALHVPIGDRDFFRWQVREWLVSCLPLLLLSATAYLYLLVYSSSAGGSGLFMWALLGALAQTVIVVTLSLSQVLWLARIRTEPALALYALIACIFFFPKELASLGGKALAFLPATWVNLWLLSSGVGIRDVVLLIAFIGLLAAADGWLVRSLEQSYPRTDLTLLLQHASDEPLSADELTDPATARNAATYGRDYAVAQERLASLRHRSVIVDLLPTSGVDWNTGHWTTRAAGRWLTPRQRLVAEFLSANAIDSWKGRWRRTLQLTAAGVVLCLIPIEAPLWLSLGVFAMAAFIGALFSGATWPGLRAGRFGFDRLQPMAGYPIGYTEASFSMMKVNAVRLLALTPSALTGGLLIGWRYFGQPTTGLLISAQILLTSLAVQPYCAMFLHSAGTNDTRRLNRTSLSFACALIANAALFIPAAIAFFAFNRSFVSWTIGPVVLALLSFSMWRFYGFLYSRHQIDLIPASA